MKQKAVDDQPIQSPVHSQADLIWPGGPFKQHVFSYQQYMLLYEYIANDC
jgi:hypothetical protein